MPACFALENYLVRFKYFGVLGFFEGTLLLSNKVILDTVERLRKYRVLCWDKILKKIEFLRGGNPTNHI